MKGIRVAHTGNKPVLPPDRPGKPSGFVIVAALITIAIGGIGWWQSLKHGSAAGASPMVTIAGVTVLLAAALWGFSTSGVARKVWMVVTVAAIVVWTYVLARI